MRLFGRNGSIFQVIKINKRLVMTIQKAIQELTIQISLLNYKKNEILFSKLFLMHYVYNEKNGRVVHVLGVQVPILRSKKSTGDGYFTNRVMPRWRILQGFCI